MYKNKNILILGAARSGTSVAKLLAKNNKVILTDMNPLEADVMSELKRLGVKIIIEADQEKLVNKRIDLIIKNPGIHPKVKPLLKAKELNIPVINEIEASFRYIPKGVKIIGITGSNGKTTTTLLVEGMLKSMNYNVVVGGNIGIPLSSVVLDIKPSDILLLEISDHQLLNFDKFKTDISVLTNVVKTHLDYHKTFHNYKCAKRKIFQHHTKTDVNIINKKNFSSILVSFNTKGVRKYFNNALNFYDKEGIYLNKELVFLRNLIKIKGDHNMENILCASLVLQEFSFDKDKILAFLKEFSGVEHRIEYVSTKGGVKFYNDSKSTNPTSTITALKSFDEEVHLILGGLERGQNFYEIKKHLSRVKVIYGVGEVLKRIEKFATDNKIKYIESKTVAQAVTDSFKLATPGSVVLFSPASASQDMYKNFEIRGEDYKNSVKNLKVEK